MPKNHAYPFSALVGQEAMKAALLLIAVDPSIGGVLIRGEKGTAKSTAARALANLLPEIGVVSGCPFHCAPGRRSTLHAECRELFTNNAPFQTAFIPTPLVELPLSATEDRVVGTLNLEKTLSLGRPCFEPGLLASANRGILYVDEVNLLGDHLVDLLLDAAAAGINIVEREGIRFLHDARFMLVGSMNPEEGEIRPQFLDRFGLCVATEGLSGAAQRTRIVTRRLEFDNDAEEFSRRWEESEMGLARQVSAARNRLPDVTLPPSMVELTSRLCIDAGVQGHRADIVIIKTARALAALTEEPAITPVQIAEASRFALPHRMALENLVDEKEFKHRLDELLRRTFQQASPVSAEMDRSDSDEWDEMASAMEVPGAPAAGSTLFAFLKKKVRTG